MIKFASLYLFKLLGLVAIYHGMRACDLDPKFESYFHSTSHLKKLKIPCVVKVLK